MKVLNWFIKSLLFGVIFLFVFNIIGRYVNLNIPINIYTLLIVSTLKIPGACMILIYNLVLYK